MKSNCNRFLEQPIQAVTQELYFTKFNDLPPELQCEISRYAMTSIGTKVALHLSLVAKRFYQW